jgi:hypothetical protein
MSTSSTAAMTTATQIYKAISPNPKTLLRGWMGTEASDGALLVRTHKTDLRCADDELTRRR